MLTNRNRHITLHCEIAVYEFCFVMILRICFERMYERILYVPCCCLYCSDNCLGTVFYLSVSSTWGRSYSLLMLRWSLTNCFVLSFRHLKSYNWLLFSSFNQWPKPLETIFFFFCILPSNVKDLKAWIWLLSLLLLCCSHHYCFFSDFLNTI